MWPSAPDEPVPPVVLDELGSGLPHSLPEDGARLLTPEEALDQLLAEPAHRLTAAAVVEQSSRMMSPPVAIPPSDP